MLSIAYRLSSFFVLTLFLGIASARYGSSSKKFSYSGNNGPDKWSNLDPTFTACSSGKRQSPITIQKNLTVPNKSLKPLTRNYKPANATLVNNGFNVELRLEEYGGEALIDSKNYSLKRLHWHIPSEHHIDVQQYAAELHLVHQAADHSLAVVAVLYQQDSKNDPFISKIMKGLKDLAKKKHKADEIAQIPMGTLNIKQLKRSCRKYYTYVGSLTTPPCSENVNWSILGKVRKISKEQIAALETLLNSKCKKNARPCQPLNGRNVEVYDELNE